MINDRKIKFTIGIPAYKAKFLKECITSVLNQVYKDFELIIVNDDSPEELDTIVEQFNDDRIRYYKNDQNFGAEHVVDNWNMCLSKAKGEYFVLMGDDDVMESNYIEAFSDLIKKYPDLDVYHCRSYRINEKSEKIDLTPSWPEYETVYDNMLHRIKGQRLQFISDFVYRTLALNQVGGFYKLPQAWGSDDISSYIACGDKGIAHTNVPVFNYRQNALTISSSGNVKLKMEAILQEGRWLENFLKTTPQRHDDVVLWKNLNAVLKKYIQKKKIMTVSRSLDWRSFEHLFYWISMKKYYNLKMIEILYSIAEYFKRVITQREY